ncbi:C-type lectin domain family 12 member A-like [Sorex araneus]|uniref:C-type lectin domain family 12 member A-like n=1 Tax=Sorex araneus TaxID=42254 RepID=UPI0024340647|nr:C-type lectin domain family 12 member A-like [Sorex araneus]
MKVLNQFIVFFVDVVNNGIFPHSRNSTEELQLSMSEEVTYADLKFQDSSKRENMVAFEKLETKACPAPSRVWHLRVLTFLCLLLLISLGVLGGMFYVTFKQHVEEVNKLQKVKDELQGNVSLQMMNNTNNTMMIGKLSCTLQEMARELCRKLYEKDQGHKCQPCPSRWIWHDDKCYLFNVDTTETWQDSKNKCWDQNATLLTIRNKSVLKFTSQHIGSATYSDATSGKECKTSSSSDPVADKTRNTSEKLTEEAGRDGSNWFGVKGILAHL